MVRRVCLGKQKQKNYRSLFRACRGQSVSVLCSWAVFSHYRKAMVRRVCLGKQKLKTPVFRGLPRRSDRFWLSVLGQSSLTDCVNRFMLFRLPPPYPACRVLRTGLWDCMIFLSKQNKSSFLDSPSPS
jgi:hypothetical protein